MIGSFQIMRNLKNLIRSIAILAIGSIVIGAIVCLLVDAILGGVN
jgi:hypothetical protein